jgi:hypothetical protein
LLNTIVKRGLARKAGYRGTRTWLLAKVPEAEGKDTALYRYAHVAAGYTKEQVELWGVNKLDALSIHDYTIRRRGDSQDPGEREIQLLQADGSTLTKKFRDCTCRELQLSNQLRRKSAKGPRQAGTLRPKNEVVAATSHPKVEVRSSRKSLAVLVLGILATSSFAFLPASFPTTLVLVFGTGLILSGIAMLIRHRRIARRALTATSKERGPPVEKNAA